MIVDKYTFYKKAKIRFRDEGNGPGLVLLHGFLESLSMWNRLVADLKGSYRLIRIDLPGHGKSECIGYVHEMEEMASAVHAVIKELKLESFVLAGHSMGGYVALAYAEKYGKDLRGICLMNSTALADSEEKKTNRERAIKAVKQSKRSFIETAIPNLFRDKNRESCSDAIRELIKEARAMDPRGIVAALEGMKMRKNRESVLASLKDRCLMIVGKHDPVLDFKSLKGQISKHEIKEAILEDGHMSHLEEYEEFSYYFVQFIENL